MIISASSRMPPNHSLIRFLSCRPMWKKKGIEAGFNGDSGGRADEMSDGGMFHLAVARLGHMNISRRLYWSLAATVLLFLILLNAVKVQDIVARAFGYTGSVPMFALDQMVRGYTPEQAFQVMTTYGQAGRRTYEFLLLTSDLVFPFLYGSFLFLSIRGASRRAGVSILWANALASFGFIATGCDWLENISFLILMRMYPRQSLGVAKLASMFTVTKFLASGISIAVLAFLGIYILIGTRRAGKLTKSS